MLLPETRQSIFSRSLLSIASLPVLRSDGDMHKPSFFIFDLSTGKKKVI